MSADLAGLAARLAELELRVEHRYGGEATHAIVGFPSPQTFIVYVADDGRAGLQIGSADVEFSDIDLTDALWGVLDAVRAWQQSGPPAAAEPVAITEEQVEAAARRMNGNSAYAHPNFDQLTPDIQGSYRRWARAVLEAAESARRGEGK